MSLVVTPSNSRFDTRGLPEGYDPHKFYEYKFQKLVNDATGVEKYLYEFIPYSIIRSFAVAIDPLYKFRVSSRPITPANRVKWRYNSTLFQKRSSYNTRTYTTTQPTVNYGNVGGCYSPYVVTTVATDPPYTTNYSAQVPLPDYLNDTTRRTRLVGSDQGTLSLFKSSIFSPPRRVSTRDTRFSEISNPPPPPPNACIIAGGTFNNKQWLTDERVRQQTGPAATLSLGTFQSLRTSELAFNVALCNDHALGLVKGWSPFNRDYSLIRNIVELRDIPHSVHSLRETVRNARELYTSLSHSPSLRKIIFDLKASSKDIPNEYLSYHFGWKQTWKDIQDLLSAPTKITKKINFLIKRNGLATTYRSKRLVVSGASGVSGFVYDLTDLESIDPSKGDGTFSRLERESEMRLVINATFDFPTVDPVSFREQNFSDRIGLIPRPTDVYNLVPWTWLVDWFTGLGNYVELIDNMNRDPSLINWGMLTCVTHGKLITEFQSRSRSNSQTYLNNVQTSNVDSYYVNKSTSVLDYVCETRRDVNDFLAMNQTSNTSTLSTYQKSILGALLSQRSDFSRDHFRVRS